jgi:hypothetical protein
MIFDRTLSDAKQAVTIREEKVKKGENLTADDIYILSRGFISVGDLNRIEGKQEALKGIFNDMGYYNTPMVNKLWDEESYFFKTDLQRIVKNNEILRKAYYIFASTPIDARPKAYFEDLNKIEKLLYDLEQMADDMKSRFKKCGTFNCGG